MDAIGSSDCAGLLPFALAIPLGERRHGMLVPADVEKIARMNEFAKDFPGIAVMMEGSPTHTQKPSHCTTSTTVHDGNNTFTQEDEKQDDMDSEDWQDD